MKTTINDIRHEETAWKRYIHFNHEGNDYELTLFWDEFDGYEIYWRSPNVSPQWAIDWDETKHDDMTLGHYLDDLTYNMKGNK